MEHFKKIIFSNYKAFKRYTITLDDFNILVGPNNSGKSTIIGAFRILSEGIRKASSRKAEFLTNSNDNFYGYNLALDGIPIATDNIPTDYDDDCTPQVEFILSNNDSLVLYFPQQSCCVLRCFCKAKEIIWPTDFKNHFKVAINFVPVLGPVENNEDLYQIEAARSALLSHRASRNFRNIWHHYPEKFEEFQKLISRTWPGMEILKPEILNHEDKPCLYMFCEEHRITRELYWVGFGFQVWCQMLTYIIKAENASILLIDEPDIYLHSDLQRQLVALLHERNNQVLIATHSTEIMVEADPSELVVIDKYLSTAKRIKNSNQIKALLDDVGSGLNPMLTTLAKTRKIIFVEGNDYKLLSGFARILGEDDIANRSSFALFQVGGVNLNRIKSYAEGVCDAIGTRDVRKLIIIDKDFRSPEECEYIRSQFTDEIDYTHIHERKEIENYLLIPEVLLRAIKRKLNRTSTQKPDNRRGEFAEDIYKIIETLCEENEIEPYVLSQLQAKATEFHKRESPHLDDSSINIKVIKQFTMNWKSMENKMSMVPGKDFLRYINKYLSENYRISLTHRDILSCFTKDDIPDDLSILIQELSAFIS